MAKKQSGLGKGLNALMLENSVDSMVATNTLSINEIVPNKDQPRKTFDEGALQELADSITQHGVLQPLLVRPMPTGGYQLVAGERRWRASRMAGLKEVPVVVKELSDVETMEIAIIENLQREDYALEGLSQLLGTVRTVKQHYNEHLELEGVLFTMYDSRLKLNQQVMDEVDSFFPNKAYKTRIPRSVKLAEAPSFGEPIVYYEKYSKPSFAYKKFTDEFLKKQ